MRDVVARTRDTQRMIDEDSWLCTVVRRAANLDNADTTFTFTGRVSRAVFQVVTGERLPQRLAGEQTSSVGIWQVLAPAGTPAMLRGDEVRAVQGAIVHQMEVVSGAVLPYKGIATAKEGE